MDAANAMNRIAEAVEDAMGDPDQDGKRFLPRSVRYAAAEAAANVVIAWKLVGDDDV